jgi:integrase
MITVALATPMRRPELMNCTWADVDFDTQTIEVNLKDNTKDTWKWLIKDAEHNCEKIVFRRERWLRYVKVAGQ